MGCGCKEGKIYQIGMGCCRPVLGPIENYYTKGQIDEMIENIEVSACCITADEVDEKIEAATSGCNCDLSDYYTKDDVYNKIEIDNMFLSGGTFDPSQYYTKDNCDDKFALKDEIPSLSGYATQEWVIDKHYVTESTFNTYIANLQQQINSLIVSISGCCSQTGETEYRWITMTGVNDYTCSGTTKMSKEKQQSSTDGGMTWTDTGQYRTGSTVLEYNSADCGYVPEPEYRWKAAPTSDYMCSGTSKYYKVYYEVSYDGGTTWQHVEPEETRRGSLIEENSTDCGYITPQYRWKAAPTSDYMCSGTSKYYKVYYEVSYDGGTTWQHAVPEQTRRGSLIEENSTDCGYIPPSYKMTSMLRNGDTHNIECNSSSTLTKDETKLVIGAYVSVEIGSCVTSIEDKAFLNQVFLTAVTIPSSVTSIGYMSFADTGMKVLNLSEGLITIGNGAFKANEQLSSVTIPNSVTSIVGDAFYVNKIQTLTIGSGVTSIGSGCFNRTSMSGSTITILATTPPTLGGSHIFDGWDDAPIYVPAASVNAYKTAWSQYADRIQAIP